LEGCFSLLSSAFAFVGALSFAMTYRIATLDAKSSLNRLLALGFFFIGVYEVANSVTVVAPNAQWFWLGCTVASSFFICAAPIVLGSLLNFAGVRGRRWWAILSLPISLTVVQLILIFTGSWLVTGYHATAWGNVYEVTNAWLPNAVRKFSSCVNTAMGLGALCYAWFHSRSKLYRFLTLQLALLAVLSNVWGAFCLAVVWGHWGFPDPTGIGAAIVLIGYAWLIRRYQHLTERRPDMTGPLLAILQGTAVFADTKGIVVLSPPQAVHFFGHELLGLPLTGILADHIELAEFWAAAMADGRPRLDLEGTINRGRFRVSIYPHHNPFDEIDGALVRIVPEGPIDQAVLEFELTAREKEVAQLMCDGYSRNQIAEALFISVATVKNHMHKIFSKTQTSGQTELVRMLLTVNSSE
jgi:DNA-binding CsgD family transcriptional regulator